MPVLKNNKVVPSEFRPNTAIILATSNIEKGKKTFPRPWSKGNIEVWKLKHLSTLHSTHTHTSQNTIKKLAIRAERYTASA
jgi:hypothetical protein